MLLNKFSIASGIGDPAFRNAHDIVRRVGYQRGWTIAHIASRGMVHFAKLTRSLRDLLQRDAV